MYFVARLLPKSKIDLKGKYVLITGCDRGFGRETAMALDKMGARVLTTCLTKEGEQSLKSATSEKLKTFQMDVTNSQPIKDVCSEVKKEISSGTLQLRPYHAIPIVFIQAKSKHHSSISHAEFSVFVRFLKNLL